MYFYIKGDRVKLTQRAIKMGLATGNFNNDKPTKGVVTADQVDNLITVLRDNRKIAQSYHASFWVLDH